MSNETCPTECVQTNHPGMEHEQWLLNVAKAEVWDEAAEAVSDWMWNNPGPSGISQDPPRNPYRADRLTP